MDKSKLLVVVDMQNDFVDGALGSHEAKYAVDMVCKKIRDFDGHVCFTMDTHYDDYLETVEGRHIPVPHCINETWGWQFDYRIAAVRGPKAFTVYKDTFGSTDLVDLVRDLEIKDVQLVGLCTDICVISNALLLKAHLPEINISVDASCCAGTTPQMHQEALNVMKRCCIDIVNDT